MDRLFYEKDFIELLIKFKLKQSDIVDALIDVANNESIELKPIQSEDIAFIQFTSGTTNNQKGVRISHYNFVDNTIKVLTRSHANENDIMINILPFTHNLGLILLLASLLGGFTCILMPISDVIQKPSRWLEAMSLYKGTISGAPNSFYDLCLKYIPDSLVSTLDLSPWKIAFNGGEKVQPTTLRYFINKYAKAGFKPKAFFPGYGITECTLVVSCHEEGEVYQSLLLDTKKLDDFVVSILDNSILDNDNPISAASKELISNGKVFEDDTIIIVDPDTREIITDGVGELWIQSKSVTHRYFNNENESKHRYDCFLSNGEGPFLSTGDLAFLHKGHLYITGRISDLILINGQNYYATDIETTIYGSFMQTAGNAVVFPYEEANQEKVCALIGLSVDESASKEGLMDMCKTIRDNCFSRNGVYINKIAIVDPKYIAKTAIGKNRRNIIKKSFESKSIEVICQLEGM